MPISLFSHWQIAKSCCPQGMGKAGGESLHFGILVTLVGVLFEGSWRGLGG